MLIRKGNINVTCPPTLFVPVMLGARLRVNMDPTELPVKRAQNSLKLALAECFTTGHVQLET